jgi:hypothetical protein
MPGSAQPQAAKSARKFLDPARMMDVKEDGTDATRLK